MMVTGSAENLRYGQEIDTVVEQFKSKKPFFAKKFIDDLLKNSNEIIIFGGGSFGQNIYMRFLKPAGVNVVNYCDNNQSKWGLTIINGIKCISSEELSQRKKINIVVAINNHSDVIVDQCVSLGIKRGNIFIAPVHMFSWACNYRCSVEESLCDEMAEGIKKCLGFFENDSHSKELMVELLTHRLLDASKSFVSDGTQYFIPELPIRDNEAFVDGGAYIGDTLEKFVRNIPDGMERSGVKYYAFECGNENLKLLNDTINRIGPAFTVDTYPIALWNTKADLVFTEDCKDGGAVSQVDVGVTVLADKLDSILGIDNNVSWIKMDIEGAEMHALEGCAETIRRNKPRLSICVYHELEDLYAIPQYIKSLRNDYKMLLRHHSDRENEVVLYAY